MSGEASRSTRARRGRSRVPRPRAGSGCQTRKYAPCGSWITAIRPASITSKEVRARCSPSSFARSTVASASATDTYEFHVGGAPASRCCSGCGEIAATSFPSTRIIE